MELEIGKQMILIVDDMPMNIQILARALKKSYQIKTEIQGARTVSKKIQNNMTSLRISHNNSQVASPVTLSLGIAGMIPNGHYSMVEFIEAADEMLYKAKDKGRNRVEYICLD